MQLTLKADYSLRALIYLATQSGRLVSTAEIAGAFGISTNHLVKVMLDLSRNGFIRSQRGRTGGNSLARDPSEINLGQVLRCVETDFRIVECFDETTNTCPISPICTLKPVLFKAGHAFLAVLDQYTLADLVPPASFPFYRNHFLNRYGDEIIERISP